MRLRPVKANICLSLRDAAMLTKLLGEQVLTITPKLAESIISEYSGSHDADGNFSGNGRAVFRNGNIYEGIFDRGNMHGHGLMIWPNGVRYDGQFRYNALEGHATYAFPDGSSYVGAVSASLRHGHGTFTTPDGGSYTGEWVKGKRQGQGTMKYDAHGLQVYTGSFEQDVRCGKGSMKYASGNVYEGCWSNDVRDGEGVMTWAGGAQVYEGSWKEGQPSGAGRMQWHVKSAGSGSAQWQCSNMYYGTWRNGLREGSGTFTYADGSSYNGHWHLGMKHGHGVFVFGNGSVYNGRFDNDRMIDRPSDTSPSPAPAVSEPPSVVKETGRKKAAAAEEPPADKAKAAPHAASAPATSNKLLYGDADIVLHIDDLLDAVPPPHTRTQELLTIKRSLLNDLPQLKNIFRHYSKSQSGLAAAALNGGDMPVPNAFAMTLMDVWQLTRDCSLADSSLSLGDIDRIFIRVQRKEGHGGSAHAPQRLLLFNDFIEGIVRMADKRFASEPNLSSRVTLMMTNHILKSAAPAVAEHGASPLMDEAVQSTLSPRLEFLQARYQQYASAAKAVSSRRRLLYHERVMCVGDLLRFFKGSGLILDVTAAQNLLEAAKAGMEAAAEEDARITEEWQAKAQASDAAIAAAKKPADKAPLEAQKAADAEAAQLHAAAAEQRAQTNLKAVSNAQAAVEKAQSALTTSDIIEASVVGVAEVRGVHAAHTRLQAYLNVAFDNAELRALNAANIDCDITFMQVCLFVCVA
jgi:hypothetical protein